MHYAAAFFVAAFCFLVVNKQLKAFKV